MPRLQNPETGLVVNCEGDLAERYQSRGWDALDGAPQPATEAASVKPQNETDTDDTDDEEKPARRRQARRR